MKLLLAIVVAAACGPPKTSTVAQPSGPLLYDRIGGMDVIKDIVRDFVVEQLPKGQLAARFTNVDVARLEENLAIQLCAQTGGPCKYTGRSMREAHANLALTDDDLGAFVAEFEKSLAKLNVGTLERQQLVALLRKQRDEIVTE